jgi:hypothetical protein
MSSCGATQWTKPRSCIVHISIVLNLHTLQDVPLGGTSRFACVLCHFLRLLLCTILSCNMDQIIRYTSKSVSKKSYCDLIMLRESLIWFLVDLQCGLSNFVIFSQSISIKCSKIHICFTYLDKALTQN